MLYLYVLQNVCFCPLQTIKLSRTTSQFYNNKYSGKRWINKWNCQKYRVVCSDVSINNTNPPEFQSNLPFLKTVGSTDREIGGGGEVFCLNVFV